MDVMKVLDEMENHPNILNAGMVLVHLGRVRGHDLEKRSVETLEVKHDEAKAEEIRQDLLKREGIVEIQIRLNQGVLKPGDPVMIAAVAGETRDQVIPLMTDLINRLKKEASNKTEILK